MYKRRDFEFLFRTAVKKYVLVILFFSGFSINSKAQFQSATIGVDGLTCSMCSNAVERLIRQLDFVEDVKMDLNTTTCEVTFHQGKKVQIYKLAQKVVDAGFSVRMIQAIFKFDHGFANEGEKFVFEDDEYIFVKTSGDELAGDKKIIFIGKKYVPKKEFLNWNAVINKYKSTSKEKNQIYYITL